MLPDENNKQTIARCSPFSFSAFSKEPHRDESEETLHEAEIPMKNSVNTGKLLKQFIISISGDIARTSIPFFFYEKPFCT